MTNTKFYRIWATLKHKRTNLISKSYEGAALCKLTPRLEAGGFPPTVLNLEIFTLQYAFSPILGGIQCNCEYTGRLTFWIPTKRYESLDPRYYFYNRETPDAPMTSVCATLAVCFPTGVAVSAKSTVP